MYQITLVKFHLGRLGLDVYARNVTLHNTVEIFYNSSSLNSVRQFQFLSREKTSRPRWPMWPILMIIFLAEGKPILFSELRLGDNY
jgi:hypothetical protein